MDECVLVYEGRGGGFLSPRDLEYKDGASKKVGV